MVYNSIDPRSTVERPYPNYAVNREYYTINNTFASLDDEGPLGASIGVARSAGGVAILDAGCGTGLGLITLKEQVVSSGGATEESVEAVGVSLGDYKEQFAGNQERAAKLLAGYVILKVGNLATIELPAEHFDIAYSLQVMVHNKVISPIIYSVMASLKSGGVYYFDTSVGQTEEVEAIAATLNPDEWQLQSKDRADGNRRGVATPYIHKLSRSR